MDDHRLDELTTRYRASLGEAPPAVADLAMATFREQARARSFDLVRIALAVIGLAGLAIDLPVVLGTSNHTGQDVAVLHIALAVGFLVAAWRPARYARGLAPVALAAAVMLAVPGLSDGGATAGRGPMAELSHLPVLAGAVTLALGGWLGQPGRRRTS